VNHIIYVQWRRFPHKSQDNNVKEYTSSAVHLMVMGDINNLVVPSEV